MDNINIYASDHALGVDDPTAVMVSVRTGPSLIIGMTIAQARDISHRIARAADDAELKLNGDVQ